MSSDYLQHYEKFLAKHYTWVFGRIEDGKQLATEILTDLLGDKEHGGPALDLGCGPGYFSLALAAHGCRVTAVDSSDFLLEILNNEKDGNYDITTYAGDMLAYLNNCEDSSVELITIMGDTIAYLDNEADFASLCRDAYRVLTPDGRLLISYRDQTVAKSGNRLVFPMRTEENKMFVAAAEFTDENTKITDSLFTFNDGKWQVESSSYTKLRLRKQRIEAVVKQSAFDQVKLSNRGGLEYLIAIKE